MKKLTIGALVAAQLLGVAQPADAADLFERDMPQIGAFAGARLRIPLGGAREEQGLRAGLTLAPTMRIRNADGVSRLRFGEGFELGVTQHHPLELSFAGQRVDRLGIAPGGNAPDGARAGISTLGWVAIGIGSFVVVGAVAGYLWFEDAIDCDPGDDCT
jgi:hypothetical protein